MAEKRPLIYSIDFDKTIAKGGKFPEIGEPNEAVVEYIRKIQERGDQWFLWTNREGKDLDMALAWLAERGLKPECANDNLPQMKAFFKGNPRKPFANVCIDDLNAGGLYLPPLDGGLDFGSAIRLLRTGHRLSRRTWEADVYVFMASDFAMHTEVSLADLQDKPVTTSNALVLRRKDCSLQVGWTPSQDDLMAEDWKVVGDPAPLAHKDDGKAEAAQPKPGGGMTWQEAVNVLTRGGKVARRDWPKDKYFQLLVRDKVPEGGAPVEGLPSSAYDIDKGAATPPVSLCCVVAGYVGRDWIVPDAEKQRNDWFEVKE